MLLNRRVRDIYSFTKAKAQFITTLVGLEQFNGSTDGDTVVLGVEREQKSNISFSVGHWNIHAKSASRIVIVFIVPLVTFILFGMLSSMTWQKGDPADQGPLFCVFGFPPRAKRKLSRAYI